MIGAMRKILRLIRLPDANTEQGQYRRQQTPQVIDSDALENILDNPHDERFRDNA
jgi:hypothetical protein